jgi:phosphotriesterase-related protein
VRVTGEIRTVLGPVAPERIGTTLTHEHVVLEMWAADGQTHVGQLRDHAVLRAELEAFAAVGGSCLVDQTPGGAGRDPLELVALSEETGVAIVTGCGFYTEPFYPPAANLARRSVDDIAEELVAEIEGGLDGTASGPA